jgi:hypothetical protein
MADFDLTHPVVQEKVKERFGANTPADDAVISPAAIYSAPNLVTVYTN